MKKCKKILPVIRQSLLTFLLFFALDVLFTYFRGNDVNVPESLVDSAVFCVIHFAVTIYSQRKKKAEEAEEDADNPE